MLLEQRLDAHAEEGMDTRLSRLYVADDEINQINICLRKLLEDTSATYAMLLDKSGQVITVQGEMHNHDTTILGALIAGCFASAKEVAKVLKEDDFRVLFQQGEHENIVTSLVEDQWMLSVIFDRRTHIGLVKVLSKRAGTDLQAILETVRRSTTVRERIFDDGLRTSIEEAIDQIFQDVE